MILPRFHRWVRKPSPSRPPPEPGHARVSTEGLAVAGVTVSMVGPAASQFGRGDRGDKLRPAEGRGDAERR
jgi:hypothetical protein